MNVAIVGAGIMGLAAAWGFVRAGHRVAVYDRRSIPNPDGASNDDHRAIRQPYGAMTGYGAMVDHAYRAWELLWADLGVRHYVETGTLILAAPGEGWAQDSADDMTRRGVPFRWIGANEQARLLPMLRPRRNGRAFWTPTGGALLAGRIVADLATHLLARGVVLHPYVPVAAIDGDAGAIRLTDGRIAQADLIVIAAGAWAARLLPDYAARLIPSRQIVVYLQPPPELEASWVTAPILADLDGGNGFYVMPPVAGTGLKIGDHRFSRSGDPLGDRAVSAAEIDALLANCRDRIVDFDRYGIARARACFYTVTDDERFVVRPIGRAAWVASACSGHGFKFGALLGLKLAEAMAVGAGADFARWAAG